MRIPTLHLLVRRRASRTVAFLQIATLLLALMACAACLSGIASDGAIGGAQAGALALRPGTMSAALLPEPGAWMITTLGLIGLEWMARRKRVA